MSAIADPLADIKREKRIKLVDAWAEVISDKTRGGARDGRAA